MSLKNPRHAMYSPKARAQALARLQAAQTSTEESENPTECPLCHRQGTEFKGKTGLAKHIFWCEKKHAKANV